MKVADSDTAHCQHYCLPLSDPQTQHNVRTERTSEVKLNFFFVPRRINHAQEIESLSQGKHKDFITEMELRLRSSKHVLFWTALITRHLSKHKQNQVIKKMYHLSGLSNLHWLPKSSCNALEYLLVFISECFLTY